MRAVRSRLIGQSMALIVAIVAIPVSASALARTTRAVVNTRSGAVRGVVRGAYRVFQGIPYAAPPVGRLRWRPPQPAAHWKGIRDATRPGSPCAQLPLTVLPGGKAILPGASNLTGSTSENCLYLNVWTPARPTHPRPVFVWFHGGNDIYGAGSDYDGSKLAVEGGVVVVTVNYRLGPLGYLALPALSAQSPDHTSGDYGLMDQVAALRWVRANIAAFGGNPNQVTVGGQSAGAWAGCDLIASPAARGLFERAILESGTCAAGGSGSNATAPDFDAGGGRGRRPDLRRFGRLQRCGNAAELPTRATRLEVDLGRTGRDVGSEHRPCRAPDLAGGSVGEGPDQSRSRAGRHHP